MSEIAEGDPIKYIGAFYPQGQQDRNYDAWKVCAADLNVVLASWYNFDDQSFTNKVVQQFMNNYNTRVAICWDVC